MNEYKSAEQVSFEVSNPGQQYCSPSSSEDEQDHTCVPGRKSAASGKKELYGIFTKLSGKKSCPSVPRLPVVKSIYPQTVKKPVQSKPRDVKKTAVAAPVIDQILKSFDIGPFWIWTQWPTNPMLGPRLGLTRRQRLERALKLNLEHILPPGLQEYARNNAQLFEKPALLDTGKVAN